MKRSVFRNRALPYLLVLPQIAVTVVFFFWPAFESLRLSLFRTSPFGDKTSFVGLENFRKLLTTPEYYQSIANTFVFASAVTAIGLGAGLFVAALATQKIRGLAAYRTAVLWPYGIAPPIAGIIFLFIFHPSYGVLPYWLGFVTSYEFNWLLKGWVAMALVILATAWTHVGYNIAFFLAGLLAIPTSVLEAASVDGAGAIRRFRSIIFPLLSPITFYLLVSAGGTFAAPARVAALPRVVEAPRRRAFDWGSVVVHALLLICVAVIAFPLYYAFVISTQTVQEVVARPPILRPSVHLLENYAEAWGRSHMPRLLWNSAIVAVVSALGKIAISMLSAFAIVYFNFRGKAIAFWLIFITLMLPVEVRIMSTYEVIGSLGWLNSYAGLTVPLMASATATFLFRQFYMTVPNELVEAAQLDGVGPLRFLWAFLLPLSWANIAALFVVLFIFGWNQYLWPLMITNTETMRVVVIGLQDLIPRTGTHVPEWNVMMAAAMMALLPPVAVILVMQRWFVKGLIETEK